MNRLAKILYTAMILIIIGFITGCGYRFSSVEDIPANVGRIAINTFENRTGETGIESIITNDVINEFTRHPHVEVTGAANAEAILTGVIRSARTRSLSHRSAYTTAEREITILVDVTLLAPDGGVLWSARAIEASQDYAVATDKIRTEQNKRSAVANLSGRLAQRIFYRMTDRF